MPGIIGFISANPQRDEAILDRDGVRNLPSAQLCCVPPAI